MNDALVIEASVAIKWLIPEEFSDQAEALLIESRRERKRLVAPTLLFSEVANAVFQRQRRRDITVAQAERALIWFFDLPILAVHTPDLHTQAFRFARRHWLQSVYDAEYAIVVQMTHSPLWTADRALFDSVREPRYWIRWIGEYPSPSPASSRR